MSGRAERKTMLRRTSFPGCEAMGVPPMSRKLATPGMEMYGADFAIFAAEERVPCE